MTSGAPNVLISNQPTALVGDMCTCIGPPDTIVMGSATVLVNNRPAARMGDSTAHGGFITMGAITTLIGG